MSAQPQAPDRDVLRALRVLIVDDNPGDRFLYKQMLTEADPGTQFSFEEAVSGAEALERVAAVRPDCVLLDYLLPDMVGTELLDSLCDAENGARMPIVMLTGFGDESTAVNALQGGAQGYISKRELTGPALSRSIDRAIRACDSSAALEQSRREMAQKNRELEGKYQDIEMFYRQLVGGLQSPARGIRDALVGLSRAQAGGDAGDRKPCLTALCADAERLVMTLSNLADNPDLNLGKLLISTCPASMMEMVSDAVNTFRPAAESAGVRISVKVQPGLPEVPVDRYRIEQVLANLLDNAIRNTPERGKVHLSVERLPRNPEELTVCISDTGVGLDDARLARVLEGGHDNMQAGESESHGLGLRICREIVRAHGGHIEVRSLPEAGTSFTFTLPLDGNPARGASPWERGAQRARPAAVRIEPRPYPVHRAVAG